MVHFIINYQAKGPEVQGWVKSHLVGADHHRFHEGGCVWMEPCRLHCLLRVLCSELGI